MPGSLPTNWLDALNWGTSTAGAAGLAETTNTLGTDRLDVRVPPDQYRIGGLQISQMKNLLMKISQFNLGGTRLQVLTQTANPFGGTESGFYMDTSGVAYKVFNGAATSLGGGGSIGGSIAVNQIAYGSGANTIQGSATLTYNGTALAVAPSATSSGAVAPFAFTAPASTAQTASTEVNGLTLNLSATRQWSTGALTTQREFLVQAPTYAFVGASTITDAATLDITGPPIAGTNATITNPWALRVESGNWGFGSGASLKAVSQGATNTTGLTIQPNVANGASSIALVINSGTALSTAGSKIVSIQDAGTEKLYIGRSGTANGIYLVNPAGTVGVQSASGGAGQVLSPSSNGYLNVDDVTGTALNYSSSKFLVDSTNQTMTGSGTTSQFKRISIGEKLNRTATAVSYSIVLSDHIIGVTSTAAARTITLPAPSSAGAGAEYIVKDESNAAATNNITVARNGAENIDGAAANKVINTNSGVVRIYCDGTNWWTY